MEREGKTSPKEVVAAFVENTANVKNMFLAAMIASGLEGATTGNENFGIAAAIFLVSAVAFDLISKHEKGNL